MARIQSTQPSTGGGGSGGPEVDPIAGPAVTTERNRAQAAESAEVTNRNTAIAGHASAADPHGDRAHGDTALATHTGAADPHGDRGYADTRIAALVNAAPAALDTLAEIDQQLQSDEAGAASMLTSINQNATNLGDHLADPTDAHDASAVSVNPSGLVVVNTTDVQAALAQLDARVNTNTQNTKFTNDLIGNRPTPAAFGIGWYFARDDNLGTLYHSDGTTWTKITAGVGWASGQQLAYSPINTISPVVNSTTAADIDAALTITVPASSVPVKVQGRIVGQQATGATAAVGSFDTLVVALTDAANNVLDFDPSPAVQVSLASKTWYHTFKVETVLPAPFAGGTYKLRTYLLSALPTGWSASLLATGPTWPKAWIEAVAE